MKATKRKLEEALYKLEDTPRTGDKEIDEATDDLISRTKHLIGFINAVQAGTANRK